jgi:hypothetical protein
MWRKKDSGFPQKLVEELGEIKKALFAFLWFVLRNTYPNESERTISLAASSVLNELVLFDLTIEQASFREANTELIEDTKRAAMEDEVFRTGIVCHLACKGGLFGTWGHPLAGMWIEGAKSIDPKVHIPASQEEVQGEIRRWLSYYQAISKKY